MSAIRVVTFSRHGATDEVGAWITDTLNSQIADSTRFNSSVSGDQTLGLKEADTIIVGAPVYAQKWMAEARHFLTAQAALLSRRQLWVFACSLRRLIFLTAPDWAGGLRPAGQTWFGGRLEWNRLRAAEKVLMAALGQGEVDTRIRSEVEAWALEIARTRLFVNA
jgi:menaquinone-dependent protoporphyrinogen IX oxidase